MYKRQVWLRGSTESVYPGRDDWLFYRPDVEYVTGPGFLEEATLAARRQVDPEQEPESLPALIEMRDALEARGIALLVVPVPLKPTIYPERFAARATALTRGAQNASYATWVARLEAEGIDVIDLTTDFSEARQTAPAPVSYTHLTLPTIYSV